MSRQSNRHPEAAKRLKDLASATGRRSFAALRMTVLFLCIGGAIPAAHADPYTYAPEGCEFRATLPGEPFKETRCDPENPAKCSDVLSYTKVFDIDATVIVSLTCNPAEENMYEHYSGDVMEATLRAMARASGLDEAETSFEQDEHAKKAMILGSGKSGLNEKIHAGQIWIGHKSTLTVEGDLIGGQVDEADKMFADILRSIRHESADAGQDKQEKPEESKEKEKKD